MKPAACLPRASWPIWPYSTDDYFSISDEEIKSLESVLTILGGKPVYATEEFEPLDPGDSARHARLVARAAVTAGYWKADPQPDLRDAHAEDVDVSQHVLICAKATPSTSLSGCLGSRGLLDGGCECFAF